MSTAACTTTIGTAVDGGRAGDRSTEPSAGAPRRAGRGHGLRGNVGPGRRAVPDDLRRCDSTASALRALVENPAIRIIFGPPVALDNAGGFTVWRTGTPLLVLGSVWILLAATRITRGEEDAGRYELLLAGPLRKVSLVLRSIVAVTAAALVISAAVGIALVLAGTTSTGAIVYAAAVFGVILTFATGAVLAAQIMPTRSSAVGCDGCPARRGPAGTDACRRRAAACLVGWTTPFGLTARAARTQPTGSAPCWFSQPFRSRSGWPRW